MLKGDPDKILSYGMVGGGPGSFIGEVHRRAIGLLGGTRLEAGAFSRDRTKSQALGTELGLEPSRIYPDPLTMARTEASLPGGIDFAVIAAPNDVHYPAARAFLEAGIAVVCDKPLALSVEEGEALAALARDRKLLFCTTYTYSGYPAVKEARRLVAAGRLGALRFIQVEYLQEWLSRPLETQAGADKVWRLDPARTGAASSLGDIGTHAEHLVSYVTGRAITRVAARIEALVPGRGLDDTASILAELEGGVSALIWTSQAVPGASNGLSFRIVGSEASLAWRQEDPEALVLSPFGEPEQRLRRGRDFGPGDLPFHRLPAGHPGGFYEAFAGLYEPFLRALAEKKAGHGAEPGDRADSKPDFPDAEAGLAGLRFMAACGESSRLKAAWTKV